jgi:hypothetical protein
VVIGGKARERLRREQRSSRTGEQVRKRPGTCSHYAKGRKRPKKGEKCIVRFSLGAGARGASATPLTPLKLGSDYTAASSNYPHESCPLFQPREQMIR